ESKRLGYFRLNQIAWHRVDPRSPQYGLEAEGLFYSKEAVRVLQTKPPDAPSEPREFAGWLAGWRHTLAWAHYRNRHFKEAIQMMKMAGPEPGDMPRLEDEILRWEDGSAMFEHANLQQEVDQLTREKEAWGSVRASDPGTILWHDQLMRIVTSLESLGQRLTSNEQNRSISWEDASAAIRKNPNYNGFEVSPQVDLVPLGPDPESGLWEFAHVPSGKPPNRDATTGRLEQTVETGTVFVLLPEAVVNIRDGASFEPTTKVHLVAFFLSKYEMTQAQWLRLRPDWSLLFDWEAPRRPVHRVSCDDCSDTLERSRWLRLPTCAQWEYACWYGNSPGAWGGPEFEPVLRGVAWDDLPPRQVGSKPANKFGLHDMFGNVEEWCCDDPTPVVRPRPGDGMRQVGNRASVDVGVMGGSAVKPDTWIGMKARSERTIRTGLRPARRLMM
ncbi:MAG: SUMF1/EgtB/PvdO family nonheme iron enzyme, partial [Planctomycetota bacterium]